MPSESIEDTFWDVKDNMNYFYFVNRFIVNTATFKGDYSLSKNIAYNLQYLEFLINAKTFRIHNTLQIEFGKTIVVVGMGIIESICYYLIKSKGLQPKREWKEVGSKETISSSGDNKSVVKDYIKIKPVEKQMTFEMMLRILRKNRLIDNDRYKSMSELRDLRNRIHIHINKQRLDTDYHNFRVEHVESVRQLLWDMFNSPAFNNGTRVTTNTLMKFLKS